VEGGASNFILRNINPMRMKLRRERSTLFTLYSDCSKPRSVNIKKDWILEQYRKAGMNKI